MTDRTISEAAEPPTVEQDLRGISRCWQNNGFHVYVAGPCFDTLEQAQAYRAELDAEGIKWKPQR